MTRQILDDRLAITDALHTYTWALDTQDWALARSVFAPDARLDYSLAGGPDGGVDEFIQWVSQVMAPFVMSQHFVGNLRIWPEGDRARSHAYVYSPLGLDDGRGGLTLIDSGGFYEDEWRRDGERWLIVHRREDLRWISEGRAGRRNML